MKIFLKILCMFFVISTFGQAKKETGTTLITYTFTIVTPEENAARLKKANLKKLSLKAPAVITGKVVDLETGEPLFGSYIAYKSKKGMPESLIAVADVNGEFSISIPDSVLKRKMQLEIHNLGYETKIVSFKKKALPLPALSLGLKMERNDLSETVLVEKTSRQSKIEKSNAKTSKKPVLRFIFPPDGKIVNNKGSFQIENSGTAPLVINSIHSASSDLTATIDLRIIQPGKKATVSFNLASQNPTQDFTRIISFETNSDTRRLPVSISFRAEK